MKEKLKINLDLMKPSMVLEAEGFSAMSRKKREKKVKERKKNLEVKKRKKNFSHLMKPSMVLFEELERFGTEITPAALSSRFHLRGLPDVVHFEPAKNQYQQIFQNKNSRK